MILSLLDTLAQSRTGLANSLPAIVQGKGTDLGNNKAIKGRAKRKLITQTIVLRLIDLSKSENLKKLQQSYWNTYHCQNRVYTANGRLYGRYCKNRYCTLCSAIRKADIINRYLPIIEKWPKPYFLTLTVKAVPYNKLRPVMSSMIKVFRLITGKYRKQSIRGVGSRLKGIRSLESNFNPDKRTFNPDFL